MGSGSSKSQASQKPQQSQKLPPKRPVANVNKVQEPDEDEDYMGHQLSNHVTVQHDIQRSDIQMNRKEEEHDFNRKQNEKNKKSDNKKKKDEPSYQDRQDSGLVFEDDSDMDNDIDEVLKIPMAIEYPQSKSKKDKNKNDQRGRENHRENNANNNSERDSSVGRRDENLPETYAQRLQRKQYKLQQDTLIRQKTLYRNPNEWENGAEEEYEPKGFDASRFRNANMRADGGKKIFTTNDHDELMTPRYMMQSGQNLDEVQVSRRAESPTTKQLPSYNQSELDLMAEIERDIL